MFPLHSPAPHQPSLQLNPTLNSKPVPGGDSNPLEDILELCEQKSDETQHGENSSVRISQRSEQLEVVEEERVSTQALFYLGDDTESLSTSERSCVIQTPVEVHLPMGLGYEDSGEGDSAFEDKGDPPVSEERKNSENEMCEEVLAAGGNNEVEETHAAAEDVSQDAKGHFTDVKPDHETEPDDRQGEESENIEETPLQPGVREESRNMNGGLDVDLSDSRPQAHGEEPENEDRAESDDGSHFLLSSNESIIRCSEDESLGEEMQVKSSPDDVKDWSEVEDARGKILYINGFKEKKENGQDWGDDDQQHTTNGTSPEPESASPDADQTENADFSILESSYQSGVDREFTKQEALASVLLEGAEEA